MAEYRARVEAAAAFLADQGCRPRVVLTLGSGLGPAAPPLTGAASLAYEAIPHFPRPRAPGHAGVLTWGCCAGVDLAVLQGRLHYYDGYSCRELTLPLRVLSRLGAGIALFVSASGGLDLSYTPGMVVRIRDHLNFIPDNPLRGDNIDDWGSRFPDMSVPYDPQLGETLAAAAAAAGEPVPPAGVYAAVPGPSLETPAETRFLRLAGADLVGMSTVPEVLVARHAGMRVLALALVVNVNDPDHMAPIAVEEVLAVADEACPRLRRLLTEVVARLAAREG